jgi:predicted lipoprotein with Yx(FWY)xxD motif
VKRSLLLSIVVSTAAVVIGVGAAAAHSGTPSIARATTIKAASSSLGRIVVDAKGRTLYLFEKDARGRSSCSGACAQAWPPLLTSGKPSAGKGASASLLGVTRRANGTRQVTYRGHPLYRFSGDTRPGQTNGEGSHAFGAGWYALTPAGKKIDND